MESKRESNLDSSAAARAVLAKACSAMPPNLQGVRNPSVTGLEVPQNELRLVVYPYLRVALEVEHDFLFRLTARINDLNGHLHRLVWAARGDAYNLVAASLSQRNKLVPKTGVGAIGAVVVQRNEH